MSKYAFFLEHVAIKESDSEMLVALKVAAAVEFEVMEGLVTIEQCKDLATYLRQSQLSTQLHNEGGYTVKQEVETRWNYHLTMLRSLSSQWDEVRFWN